MKATLKTMFRSLTLVLCLTGLAATQAQAHGGWGRGGYYHGGGGYYHGGGGHWVAPALIGGALLGAALARPAYAYPVTPAPVYPAVVPFGTVVAPYGTPVAPQPVGYFCPTSGQYYPYVPTCNVPWQLM